MFRNAEAFIPDILQPEILQNLYRKDLMIMKRTYVAMVLGLALTVAALPIAAAENSTEVATEAATGAAEDTAEADTEQKPTEDMQESMDGAVLIGQVSEITDSFLTLKLGTLAPAEDIPEIAGDAEAYDASPDAILENTDSKEAADTNETAEEGMTEDEAASDESADTNDADVETDDAEDAAAGTEAATDDAADALQDQEDVLPDALTITLTDESFSGTFADDFSVQELSEIQNILIAEAAAEPTEAAEDEAGAEEDTAAKDADTAEDTDAAENTDTEADAGEASADENEDTEAMDTENTDAALTSEDTETADSKTGDLLTDPAAFLADAETVEISTDSILKGDIVAVTLNEDGTVRTLTLLAYGMGDVAAETGTDFTELPDMELSDTEVSDSEPETSEIVIEEVTE